MPNESAHHISGPRRIRGAVWRRPGLAAAHHGERRATRVSDLLVGPVQDGAQEIAAGLRSIGVRKGDVVALDSETRLEFYLADLGILTAGSVAAALYPSYPPKDLIRTIQSCGAKALFVEDPKTLQALCGAPDMPRILLTGEAEGALSLEQL